MATEKRSYKYHDVYIESSMGCMAIVDVIKTYLYSKYTTSEPGEIGDHTVTFKLGVGCENEGQILIDDADRNSSNRKFNNSKGKRGEHNHYGPKREGDGWVDEDRGYYTGPGH